MKPLLLLAFLLVSPTLAQAQGQFVFNNRIGTEVNARFITAGDPCDGSYSSIGSPDWSVQLLGGPVGTPVGNLVPLEPSTTTFRGPAGSPTAGYVVAVTPVVPGVPTGGNASVLVRVVGLNGYTMDYGPFTVLGLGGGTATPPNLQLGNTPLGCIPEPSTLFLSLMGLMGIMLPSIVCRCRSWA